MVAACFALVGCESEPSNSNVTISPDSALISKGDSVEFTASGGYDYTWSMDTSAPYGVLSTRTGNKTVYTAIDEPDSGSEVRTLKVRSTIEGAGSTNANPDEWTAEAYITHQ